MVEIEFHNKPRTSYPMGLAHAINDCWFAYNNFKTITYEANDIFDKVQIYKDNEIVFIFERGVVTYISENI